MRRWNSLLFGVTVALALAAGVLHAQARPTRAKAAPASAAVEGDIFLLMQSGDVKRGAGLEVRLLRGPDEVLGLLAANCASHDAEFGRLDARKPQTYPIGDSSRMALYDAMSDSVSRLRRSTEAKARLILAEATLRAGRSNMNAHYTFEGIPAGHYALWAAFPVGRYNYQWLVPVTLTAGRRVTLDLSADTENRYAIYCGIP